MTATLTEAGVVDLVDAVLGDHPPGCTPPSEIWAAQYDAGLAWIDFPEGRGGLGADFHLQRVVDAQLRRAGVPSNNTLNWLGLVLMPSTLLEWGTPQQLDRFLRPAFTCDEIWAQLFSEPGAGSDLASLTTRAVRDGDEWVVTGQKVWTTMAHRARWALLLARTDNESKHGGLTFFICDMHAPGVEVRPLRQITGEAEYNEVFLSDVRLPDTGRVGPIGAGWKVALSTLMSERRGTVPALEGRGGNRLVGDTLDLWLKAPDPLRTAVHRDRLVRLWIEAQLLPLTLRRETTGGSIGKVAGASLKQRIAEFAVTLLGADGMLISDYEMTQPDHFRGTEDEGSGDVVKDFLSAQSLSIAGGTSNINRNIIAERILQLPAEPSKGSR